MSATWNIDGAREMRADGKSYREIGLYFGVAASTAAFRLDSAYADRHRVAVRESNRRRGRNETETDREFRATLTDAAKSRKAAGTKAVRSHVRAAIDDAEAMRQFANFPRDTRSLTGRIAGDPLWERSALYAKQQREART